MKGNTRSTSDIISTLPSNITEKVLKGLPLMDAVRTSILSRKWRHKWLTLPELVFDNQFFQNGWNNDRLKAVIYQVLLFHQGPLIKFKLRYPPFESCTDINDWIFILLTKSIQEFFLCLRGGPHHEIPCHLYSFVQLRKLHLSNCVFKPPLYSFVQLRELCLSNCVFKPPITFKGFSRLVNLTFFKVSTSSELWQLFLSNCPMLEKVELRSCSNCDSLKINAPNLKYLNFFGTFESFSLENTPLLAIISVTMPSWETNVERPDEEIESERVKFFHSLPAIEDMHLDHSFLEVLEPYPLDDPVMEYLQAEDVSEISLNMLQKVKIRYFSGAEPEMHFVKILLAHSPVLEKMVILYEPEMTGEKGFEMVKKLIRFHRASPKVELIIDETAPDGDDDPA